MSQEMIKQVIGQIYIREISNTNEEMSRRTIIYPLSLMIEYIILSQIWSKRFQHSQPRKHQM